MFWRSVWVARGRAHEGEGERHGEGSIGDGTVRGGEVEQQRRPLGGTGSRGGMGSRGAIGQRVAQRIAQRVAIREHTNMGNGRESMRGGGAQSLRNLTNSFDTTWLESSAAKTRGSQPRAQQSVQGGGRRVRRAERRSEEEAGRRRGEMSKSSSPGCRRRRSSSSNSLCPA